MIVPIILLVAASNFASHVSASSHVDPAQLLHIRNEPASNSTVKAEVSRRDGCASLNTYTPYMNDCQYQIMIEITALFETDSADYGFSVCTATPDNQGISAGFIQFTTCGGAAAQVCETYEQLYQQQFGQSSFCAAYTDALQQAIGASYCTDGSMNAYTPSGLESFCSDWTAEATGPNASLFAQAQKTIQFNAYFEKLQTEYFDASGGYAVKAPLTIAQLYDANVQIGWNGAKAVAEDATARAGGTPGQGADEYTWLTCFLSARSDYYNAQGGPFPATVYRVNAFYSMLDIPAQLFAY